MSELASVGEFCPNDQCSDAGRTGADNIIRYGKTGNGRQRYRCRTCGKTFSETTGTVFSGKRTPKDETIETLAFVAEGVRLASLSRVKGYKESTIRNWLRQAAEHAEEVEHALMANMRLIEDSWTGSGPMSGKTTKRRRTLGRKAPKKDETADSCGSDPPGEVWRATMIETETRLRVGRGIAGSEREATKAVFQTLKRHRGHPEAPRPR